MLLFDDADRFLPIRNLPIELFLAFLPWSSESFNDSSLLLFLSSSSDPHRLRCPLISASSSRRFNGTAMESMVVPLLLRNCRTTLACSSSCSFWTAAASAVSREYRVTDPRRRGRSRREEHDGLLGVRIEVVRESTAPSRPSSPYP